MEADTKIHSQSLELSLGVLTKKGGGIVEDWGAKVIAREPTETADIGFRKLKDTEPKVRSGPIPGI